MPTNFCLAFAFLWFGRDDILRSKTVFSRPLKLGMLYSVFVFCPVTLWSFYQYPAWATVYLRPEFLIPSWSGPAIVSLYAVGMLLGLLVGQPFVKSQNWKAFWSLLGVGLFWLMVCFALSWQEYFVIGTYHEFHSDKAMPIFENPDFMFDLNLMGALLAAPAIMLIFVLRRSQSAQSTD